MESVLEKLEYLTRGAGRPSQETEEEVLRLLKAGKEKAQNHAAQKHAAQTGAASQLTRG